MQRKYYLFTIGLIFMALGLAFQNFRSIPLHMTNEIQKELQPLENRSIQHVEKFYLHYKKIVGDSKKPLFYHPKDYLKSKLKNSNAYQQLKAMTDLDMEEEDRFYQSSSNQNGQKFQDDDMEIKVRYNPIKNEGRLALRDDWNADITFNGSDEDLDLQFYKRFDVSEIRLQHSPKNEETFVNYLIKW